MTSNYIIQPDVHWFVSGSKNSKASGVYGAAVFGGDLVVSGTLYANLTGTSSYATAALTASYSATTNLSLIPITVTSGSTTIPSRSGLSIFANAVSGTIDLTLPSAGFQDGAIIYIIKIDATLNFVNVYASGSQTISGQASQDFNSQYTALSITSYSNNWWII